MKYLLFIITTLVVISCNQSDSKAGKSGKPGLDTANYTNIQWLDSIKDVGKLTMGEKVAIDFRFRNTGDKPLYVISAEPGCGCTVADYPKEAILPGKEGVVKAEFDTKKGAIGAVHKNIIVVTNTRYNVNHNLFFTGEIVEEGKAEQRDTPPKKKPLPADQLILEQ
jgi:hypothetical protein